VSSPLAIGAVSAVLCNLLDDGIVEHVGGALGSVVQVSAVAPDVIDLTQPDMPPRLNLFLYRVSPNQGWWNKGLPSRSPGGDLLGAPPLALNLHYLLTSYGRTNFQAEILLGFAMHLLHERPVLDRATLRRALSPSPLGPPILPSGFASADPADLADQVEAITITLEPFDTEELSRLWTAIQAHYRPTAAYVVSVVLIQAKRPQRAALPVLSRGAVDLATGRDRGPVVQPSLDPPYPLLTEASVPAGQSAARLGDAVTLRGSKLNGTNAVVTFAHRLLAAPVQVVVGASADPTAVTVLIPSGLGASAAWPAGVYSVSFSVQPPGDTQLRTTNSVALLLAPTPTLPPTSITRDPATGAISVTLNVAPQVWPPQDTWLFLGGTGAPSGPLTGLASQLSFVLPPVRAGQQWLRLRVDGVESQLVNMNPPPSFVASQSVSVPA
jgi:Pvc16 N-terminal domain